LAGGQPVGHARRERALGDVGVPRYLREHLGTGPR
jgi:hypothetical protein